MTRFFGKIGYVSPVRSGGVTEDVPTEQDAYGDELRNTRYFAKGDNVLGEVTFQTRISVVADAYALKNYRDIRYVKDETGVAITVEQVTVERPRLILLLGDKYNGPVVEEETP